MSKLPEGWKVMSLREICRGQLQTGPFGSQLHSHEYVEDGISVVMPKDLIKYSVNLKTAAKIRPSKAEFLKKHKLETGDLLFSRRGDVSRFALINDKTADSICGTGCLRARPSKEYSPIFLSYFLQLNHIKKWLEQNAVGQTMPNMNTEILGELPLITATTFEENKIAQILSTWDKAIATTEKQIANSKQQKKALMQQLLTGKKRLAGFGGDWAVVKLSQIANITMGSSPKSSAYNELQQGLPLLQGNADIKNRKSAPRIFTSQITKECAINDILLSVRAPVGTVAKSKHHACIGRGIAAITATKDHCQAFIYQWLLNYEPKWERFSQGSTFEAVNSNDIKSLNMLMPPLKEQQKIAQVLTTADNEISTLENQLTHLQQEKKR